MVCTTFYDESEKEQLRHCDHKDLDELLGELRAATGKDWFIRKFVFTKGRLWWRRDVSYYSLYLTISGMESQIINFAPEDSGSSINHMVCPHIIMNFIMGYLNGIQSQQLEGQRLKD